MTYTAVMSAAPPLDSLCPDAAHWREQLLGATAQASRLLLESSDVMARMPEVLQLIGEAAGADRTTLALTDVGPDGERWLEIKQQWNAPGISGSPTRDAGETWSTRRADCFCGELTAGRSVYLCGNDWRADSSIAKKKASSGLVRDRPAKSLICSIG